MSKNDIIMIYTNAERKDLGVLQDYSFDMCYGDSENTFECRIQKYNSAIANDGEKIAENSLLYIEFTEYGGIIDKIQVDTKKSQITLSGRSWHGFLNSFVIEPSKGQAYKTYQGEANAVIAQIITDIGMNDWFEVSSENSGITIPFTRVRYEKAYDCIMSKLIAEDAKLIMWYQNRDSGLGKVYLKAVSRVNTGAFEDFDTSQTPFVAGKTYNQINDLICLGQGNEEKRAVIHLYADANGGILPYRRKNALQDSDYYTDLDALSRSTNPEDIANYQIISERRLTGARRYSWVYDYPSAEVTTNYIKLTTKPSNWEKVYTNYYYRDASRSDKPYVQFKQEIKESYNLLYSQPDNWASNYKDYYKKDHIADKSLKKVEDASEQQGATVVYRPNTAYDGYEGLKTVDPNRWTNYFESENSLGTDDYYVKVPQMSSYTFKKAEAVQVETYEQYTSDDPPFDWETNYKNYYYCDSTVVPEVYVPMPGEIKDTYELLTSEPTGWTRDYGNYYFKATDEGIEPGRGIRYKYLKGDYITVSLGISDGMISATHKDKSGRVYNWPKWKKKTFYIKKSIETPPKFDHWYWIHVTPDTPAIPVSMPYYKVTTAKAPVFEEGKYYQKYVETIPQWRPQTERYEQIDGVWTLVEDFGGYYEKVKNEIIPKFEKQDVYYAVQDRYAILCSDAEKKLAELADKDTLDITLELESNYDVGDIIGGVDEDTGIDVTKQILRKIIKIKKDILSVDYEVD